MHDCGRSGADWRWRGAVGLVARLFLPVPGIAAAEGLTLLMVGAIAAHGRVNELRHAAPAAMSLALTVADIAVGLMSS